MTEICGSSAHILYSNSFEKYRSVIFLVFLDKWHEFFFFIIYFASEQKAKEAETHLRESARKARVEYNESLRRSFTVVQAAQDLAAGSNKHTVKPPLPPK